MDRQNRAEFGQSRLTRRQALGAAVWTGAGFVAAAAVGCGKSTTTSSGSTSGQAVQPSAAAARTQAVNSVIGRTGVDAATEQPALGGTLNWYVTGNPPSLDPHRSASSITYGYNSAVLSRLFRYKNFFDVAQSNNKEIEPDLAASIEAVDAATWTVKLRPGISFHNIAPVNGHPFDAEDVKASFIRVLDPKSANRGSLAMIDPARIEMPDKNTLVFKLNYAYAPFPKLLASGLYSWILPREANSGDYDPAVKSIGTGPFTAESYTPDVAAVFKKNANWFEKGRPYIDGVKWAIVPDPAQRLAQFTAGNIDFVSVPPEDLDTMRQQNPKAELISNWDPGDGILYFQLGEAGSPFQDIRIRQAMSLALDRTAYGKVMLQDKYTLGFNVSQTMGKWALRMEDLPADTTQWYKFDLQKAKQLFEAAGGSNLDIKVIYPVPNPREPWLGTAGELVYNMLKALPWKNLNFVRIDYNKDWIGGGKGKIYGNYPVDEVPWWGLMSRADVDEYIYGYWHSKSTTNLGKLNDPRMDGMIDKARAIVDEEERRKAYLEIQRYLAAQMYSVAGMPNGLTYTMVNPRVRNYTLGDGSGLGASNWSRLWLRGG